MQRIVIALLFVGLASGSALAAEDGAKEKPKTVLALQAKTIDGKPVNLSDYSGEVVLIVNTASKCGLTPQYEALQALHKRYEDRGFKVLGFPCNDFGGQEPGDETQIKEFCKANYSVTFPLFSKVTVKGKDKHPVYDFLTSKDTNPKSSGDIKWNFTKFLIGRDGQIIERFEPRVAPDDAEVVKAIEKAIETPAPKK